MTWLQCYTRNWTRVGDEVIETELQPSILARSVQLLDWESRGTPSGSYECGERVGEVGNRISRAWERSSFRSRSFASGMARNIKQT